MHTRTLLNSQDLHGKPLVCNIFRLYLWVTSCQLCHCKCKKVILFSETFKGIFTLSLLNWFPLNSAIPRRQPPWNTWFSCSILCVISSFKPRWESNWPARNRNLSVVTVVWRRKWRGCYYHLTAVITKFDRRFKNNCAVYI